ncbi:hypothetical protein [Klebsiella pneumoniae]|uniref:hypothetical protein n=1 Tax=Klebsiella pneumoniae TaxID=573 RepID=UPI0034D2182D
MRLVLLKAQKFANQAGYYLLNGRWHKTSQDKPAPKGAPVSAHPHAAGKPVQKETLADHEWQQLQLPAENVNAKTFNKQLDQLKAAAAAGDITGILGSGYGTNTYGKKLAIIANHVLGLLGSDHKVTPGQKAGTHAAVQTAPEIEAEAPAPKPEPKPEPKAEVKPEPKPEPKAEEKPAPAPEKKGDAELAVPDFAEGKKTHGVKAYYEKVAKKIIRAAKAGDLSALQFMPTDKGQTWKGKTDNSKKLLELHQAAIAHAQANKPAGKDVQHPDAEKHAAQEAKELAKEQVTPEKKPEPKKDAEPQFTDKGTLANPSGYGKTFANLKQANAAAEKLKAQGHDVYVTAQHPYQVKLNKPEAKPEPKPEPEKQETKEPPKGDSAGKLAQIPWDSLLLPDSNKNAKSHNKQVAKIKAMAEAGDIEGLKNFKAGTNTYGKKQNLLAQTALAALEESAPAEAKAAPAEKPARAKQPEPIAETSEPNPAADGLPPKPAHEDKWTDTVNALEGWAKSGDLTEAENMYYDLFSLVDEMPDAMPVLHYAQDVVAHIKKNGAEQGGKPQKPTGLTSTHWSSTVNEIEAQMEAGNENYLLTQVQQTASLESAEAKSVHEYAVGALGFVQNQKQSSSASTDNDGPKEGETKQGANGMLVFKNGRWHKMGEEKAAEKPAPSSPADVEIPEFTGLAQHHLNSMKKAAEALKAKIAAEGKAGFKGVLTNHKDGKVTVTIDGIKISKASVSSANSAFSAFGKFVDELKAAAGAVKKAKPAPKATQAPAPAAEPEQPKQLESMDSWTQTGGQGGSNPGGKFKDENGVEWYCKFPENDHIAKAEVLAAKLYSSLGLNAQDAKLVTKDGKVGIASRWVNVKKASPKELAQTPGVLEGFAADAWLANWDVVGLGFDNLQVDDQGHAMRVDAGGSLMYRAQGSKKAFGEHVTELDSLRDPKINPQAAAVFGQMSEADITASVAKVAQISDAQIRIMVNNFGPGDKAERKALAETLIARKNDLIAKYPKAVKVKKKRLDPENLPVKEDRLPKEHDFANWNGPGAGLSGKAHVNAANQKVESEMLAIAKSGNLTKLKDYKFQPVDIATGEPKGDPIPVGQHPSKHVQQFHQDLIQALDEIANPPQPLKIFQESDLNTLDELDMAFPSKKFGTTVNAVHSNEKMGFWVVLGGVHKAAEKFMPKKITHFTTQAIDAAYQKFKEGSKLAKHFVLSVQASGSYNDLFREGKEMDHAGNKLSDVAKAAMEFATEQPEGTTVYRWQHMTKDMVDKIMSAPDGTVFQATGPMCTSMSPTATSHFGPHRITIHYAKGAKAVESFGSGKFAGEKEVTTLPNSRFVILKKEMVPAGGSKRMELEVLMLPPDLGL